MQRIICQVKPPNVPVGFLSSLGSSDQQFPLPTGSGLRRYANNAIGTFLVGVGSQREGKDEEQGKAGKENGSMPALQLLFPLPAMSRIGVG